MAFPVRKEGVPTQGASWYSFEHALRISVVRMLAGSQSDPYYYYYYYYYCPQVAMPATVQLCSEWWPGPA